jgi:diguanylate cyclase (GGDEF)-like protein
LEAKMPVFHACRRRLLLIEDDDADAMLVERALERYPGFELRHVSQLGPAFEALAADSFDVVLLDLSLPDSFGLDGVAALSSRYPDLPIVVLTGLADDALALEALERGAQDYLAKGQCSPEILVRTMRYAIQRQQIQRENQRLMSELGRQARHDGLTELANRRTLVAELECEWHRPPDAREPLACVLIDLDFFKRVNDVYGHAVGDAVLQAVARQLQANCRSLDTAGRYGGEEFLAILPHTTEEGAIAWAQRLRRALSREQIELETGTIQLTASFGVAVRGPDVSDCDALIDRADQALRLAKQLGRDRVVSYAQVAAQADVADSADDAFGQLTAAEIMTPLVAALEETTTLQEATQFLLGLRLDSAPVIDRQGRVAGLLNEEDLGRALTNHDAWQWPIAAVMRKHSPVFAADVSAAVVHEFLSRTASRRVIIVDGERPVGIVSRASILRWREYHDLASRSLLADLSDSADDLSDGRETLLALVREVENQATLLAETIEAAEVPPQGAVVACATRVQLLLEDGIVLAQRLAHRPREQMTLSGLVG